jgi:hypothetical protein
LRGFVCVFLVVRIITRILNVLSTCSALSKHPSYVLISMKFNQEAWVLEILKGTFVLKETGNIQCSPLQIFPSRAKISHGSHLHGPWSEPQKPGVAFETSEPVFRAISLRSCQRHSHSKSHQHMGLSASHTKCEENYVVS